MAAEENDAVMHRIYDVTATGNLAVAGEVIAADVIEHTPGAASAGIAYDGCR